MFGRQEVIQFVNCPVVLFALGELADKPALDNQHDTSEPKHKNICILIIMKHTVDFRPT